jgi:hypothetical protein
MLENFKIFKVKEQNNSVLIVLFDCLILTIF